MFYHFDILHEAGQSEFKSFLGGAGWRPMQKNAKNGAETDASLELFLPME
jgi:hypothetical protein